MPANGKILVTALWDRMQYLFRGKRDFPAAARVAEAFLKVVPNRPDADSALTRMPRAGQDLPAW